MRNALIAGTAIAAVLAAAGGGYWPGAHRMPEQVGAASDAVASGERRVLYWKHPDGKADFSPTPSKTDDGRDYVPVHEDQEADFKESKPAASAKAGERKILYYRNPMGLPDTSPIPKKDWMGMDYIPVYEGEEGGSTIRVSIDRVQRTGVRSEAAEMRIISRPVRAPGIAKPDERTLRTITLRADGFIEKLYADE